MYRVGVVGATGYTGQVLLSILLNHPDVEIVFITSNTYEGQKVSQVFPSFFKLFEERLIKTDQDLKGKCDVFFLCLPHGSSMEKAKELYDGKCLIIDLSADFRFEDRALYERYYTFHKAPELLSESVYGLPEIYRDTIRKKKLIANPGCYVTSALLALYPLLKRGLIDGQVFIDSKSGVSGAGRELKLGSLFCEVSEGIRAYNVGNHRHEPEIQKEVNKFQNVKITFVPHLVPMNRGILTCVYGKLKTKISTEELLDIFRTEYMSHHFVRVLDKDLFPDTRFVRFSNFCDIGGKAFEDGRFIVISAIDNLVKGASGQAVQNMNIALGLDERTGLTSLPLYP
ncbi:MAG: N-acetyl-gamma-glutamyl-phosphate reductase [Desulfobacterota bacterium]|nr:N-acetyl-gamma-glutamyl-phosphate reductase [Thermodesulfobacteriota bacterium]MDW8002613.1 N-acetyl-gamma-glutamyl-phosphate reductase [Deltaproteobacteria bacterium]